MTPNAWKAEFLGTCPLILCGLSAFAISFSYPGSLTLLSVAAVWAAALALGIALSENQSGLARREPGNEATAMIFAEYFPNPKGHPLSESRHTLVGPLEACVAGCVGTCLLSLAACGLSHPGYRGADGVCGESCDGSVDGSRGIEVAYCRCEEWDGVIE